MCCIYRIGEWQSIHIDQAPARMFLKRTQHWFSKENQRLRQIFLAVRQWRIKGK